MASIILFCNPCSNINQVTFLSRYKQNSERAFQLQQWFEHGGVCVLGYEMFRNLSADNPKKFKKKMLKNFQQSLVDPGEIHTTQVIKLIYFCK